MIKRILFSSVVGLLFAAPALAQSSLGTMQESVKVGRVISVGLNPSSSGSWYLGPNTNSAVVTASVTSGSLILSGKSTGTATVYACTDVRATDCLEVDVTVSASGSVLGASIEAAHPANTWVLSDSTVFYVSSNGLIPVATWKVFIGNGGKQSLLQTANTADLNLPLLPLMTLKDSRVHK